MDTKLKKMTANIKGVRGWFVLTVLGLTGVLGIGAGNIGFSIYADILMYAAFLLMTLAGIMLTISLKADSNEWPFFAFLDKFKTDMLLWINIFVVAGAMTAFAWVLDLYTNWKWDYGEHALITEILFLIMVLPESFVVTTCYVTCIRRLKNKAKRKDWWIVSALKKVKKEKKIKRENPVLTALRKIKSFVLSIKIEYEHSLDYQKKQMIQTILILVADLYVIYVIVFPNGSYFIALILMIANIIFYVRQRKFYQNVGKITKELHCLSIGERVHSVNIDETSPLYEAGCDLEKVNESLDMSVKRQMKSEQMKIDLITNVSHDLKTPLTSIIGYLDLLKKEEMSPEAQDYVGVISQKSEHLKDMIQDLFEISKATSGNAELVLEKLDMVKLLQQTLGDMEDRIKSSGRSIRTNFSEEVLAISGDGKKLYRVYQNLIENALKYSMDGTRIYVEARRDGQNIVTEIKNIAAYEMDFTADKIVERFQRGDVNRTTEGHGLGLAIAKSFSEACGGHLELIIDGDLFKALITYPAYVETESV